MRLFYHIYKDTAPGEPGVVCQGQGMVGSDNRRDDLLQHGVERIEERIEATQKSPAGNNACRDGNLDVLTFELAA